MVCELGDCPDCRACLTDAPVEWVTRRQVFDRLPPPPLPHVSEYPLAKRRCRCGAQVTGPAPAGVLAPVSYGPVAAALAVYVGAGQYLPVKRAAGVLATLAGMTVSTGWPAAQRSRAARLVEAQFLPHVRELLRYVGVLHANETPGRVAGKLVYVDVASTELLTAMHVGDRSVKTIGAGGVLPKFTGVVVRDGYARHAHLVNAVHAWCGAHLVWDLHAVSDADPDRQLWAIAMAQTLLDANTIAHTTRAADASATNADRLAMIANHYRGAVAKGIADNQTRTSRLAHDALVLARRFRDNEAMILRFDTDLTPFSNSEAGRSCRLVKV